MLQNRELRGAFSRICELQRPPLSWKLVSPIHCSVRPAACSLPRTYWFCCLQASHLQWGPQSSPLLLPILALRWDRYPPLLFECTWRARLAFDPAVDLFQGCHIVVKLQETEHVWRSFCTLRLRLQNLLFADVPICSRLVLQHAHHPLDDLPFTFSLAQMAWDVESWLQQVPNSRELIQNITMDDMPVQTLQDGLIQVLVQRLDLGHGQVAVQAWQLLVTLHFIQGATKSSVRMRTWERSIPHEVHLRCRHQVVGLLTQLLVEVQNITHLADLTTDCFAQLTVRPPNLTDAGQQLVARCWGKAKAIPVLRMGPNFLRWDPLHFAQLMIAQAWHQPMRCLNQLTLMLQACFNLHLHLLGDRHDCLCWIKILRASQSQSEQMPSALHTFPTWNVMKTARAILNIALHVMIIRISAYTHKHLQTSTKHSTTRTFVYEKSDCKIKLQRIFMMNSVVIVWCCCLKFWADSWRQMKHHTNHRCGQTPGARLFVPNHGGQN